MVTPKFKAGQTVRIKDISCVDGMVYPGIDTDMLQFIGQTVTIITVAGYSNRYKIYIYRLNDCGSWSWSEDWLERVVKW